MIKIIKNGDIKEVDENDLQIWLDNGFKKIILPNKRKKRSKKS